jgi:hypothetical protein
MPNRGELGDHQKTCSIGRVGSCGAAAGAAANGEGPLLGMFSAAGVR